MREKIDLSFEITPNPSIRKRETTKQRRIAFLKNMEKVQFLFSNINNLSIAESCIDRNILKDILLLFNNNKIKNLFLCNVNYDEYYDFFLESKYLEKITCELVYTDNITPNYIYDNRRYILKNSNKSNLNCLLNTSINYFHINSIKFIEEEYRYFFDFVNDIIITNKKILLNYRIIDTNDELKFLCLIKKNNLKIINKKKEKSLNYEYIYFDIEFMPTSYNKKFEIYDLNIKYK